MTPYLIYDVFTNVPFGGNPLAIFPDGDKIPVAKMQAIAREMNLSETVFLLSPKSDSATVHLRIFTPNLELPFAGHPTIGSITALAGLGLVPGDGSDFHLTCEAGKIICNFKSADMVAEAIAPLLPYQNGKAPPLEEIAIATGLTMQDFVYPAINDLWSSGPNFAFAEVKTPKILQSIKINSACFAPTGSGKMVDAALIVFCLAHIDDDIIYVRCFSPAEGIPEDPATGSAAVALSGLLHAKKLVPKGKKTFLVRQGEKMGRPSRIMLTTIAENNGLTRVTIAGSAIKMAEGNFLLLGKCGITAS